MDPWGESLASEAGSPHSSPSLFPQPGSQMKAAVDYCSKLLICFGVDMFWGCL